jgi:hypothetical protein
MLRLRVRVVNETNSIATVAVMTATESNATSCTFRTQRDACCQPLPLIVRTNNFARTRTISEARVAMTRQS